MKKLALPAALAVIAIIGANTSEASENNKMMKECVELNETFGEASACHAEYRNIIRDEKLTELRAFLKANPEYKWPGGSAGMPHPMAKMATIANYNIRAAEHGLPSYQQRIHMIMERAKAENKALKLKAMFN